MTNTLEKLNRDDDYASLGVKQIIDDQDDDFRYPEAEVPVGTQLDAEAEDPLEAMRGRLTAIESERDAAKSRADALELERSKAQAQLAQTGANEVVYQKSVLEQAYAAEELKVKSATERYRQARQANDYDAEIAVMDELNYSKSLLGQYATAYQELDNRSRQQPRQVAPQRQDYFGGDQFEAGLSQVEPKIADWARAHKEDLLIPERQKLAFQIDQLAMNRGFTPGGKAYLDYMNENMGYNTASDTGNEPSTRSRAERQVDYSAPPSRSSRAQSNDRGDHGLDPYQKAAALAAGVPEEEWAKYVSESNRDLARTKNSRRDASGGFSFKA